jgi:acetyl esterase
MALDDATAAWLEELRRIRPRPMTELTPAEAREQSAAARAQRGPGPEMAKVRNTRVKVAGGAIAVRVLLPTEQPAGVIVYYHGGGWVLGSIEDSDALGRHLAQRTGCAVVVVGYRLAPEFRYPTAVEDSWAALVWADQHMTELAGARVPLIVAGDSAGGNLAAVVARRAAQADGPQVALQVLVYPVTDCDPDTLSYTDPANQLMLTGLSMAWFWDHYAPDALARQHPDAAPLRAPVLIGLPPAVIITAEHDVLRDEGELYATRLMKADVPVRFRRFEGQMHGFFAMPGILPGADAALDYVTEAIAETLGGSAGIGARIGAEGKAHVTA